MNASDLKYHVESTCRNPHFFTRKTMRFFGDTMRNYGVRSVSIVCRSDTIDPETNVPVLETREVWELYRRRPVKEGIQTSTYFDKTSFRTVCAVSGE